ncbi:MAG: transglycosylase domain-containing protein [Campylobacterota bacterium]|nr:transglycosylase domain-containing protein [Campylobacterota bacterium]
MLKIAVTVTFLLIATVLTLSTYNSMQKVPSDLSSLFIIQKKHSFLDRNGVSLNTTYSNRWNTIDTLELYELPELFLEALLISEDQNFYNHNGVDWQARLHALWQNIKAMRRIRGASTLSEQVIKMIHPRQRTLYSKWLEGFEAQELEEKVSKKDILTFYVNQVPYAANRRGVKQAAKYYFNRDISTLSDKEILALVILVRSPRWYDPVKYPERLNGKIAQLALRLYEQHLINTIELQNIQKSKLSLSQQKQDLDVSHFIRYVSSRLANNNKEKRTIHTTLDIDLQQFIQEALNTKVLSLQHKNVHNAAVIVIDHLFFLKNIDPLF